MKTPEETALNFQSKNTDYYRRWSITTGSDDAIAIKVGGTVVTLSPQGWLDCANCSFPESDHIQAFMRAIQWYFSPADSLNVQKKYLEFMREKQKSEEKIKINRLHGAWVSVEEKLPERDGEYLVSSQYGKTSKPLLSILRVATFSTSNESRINTEGFLYTDGSIDFNVTHWMPLPPIPVFPTEVIK